PQLAARILPPPILMPAGKPPPEDQSPPNASTKDWGDAIAEGTRVSGTKASGDGGIRREPELPEHEEIAPEPKKLTQEFEPMDDDPDDDAQPHRALQRARQISLNNDDDMQ